jgi:hypothetical protein
MRFKMFLQIEGPEGTGDTHAIRNLVIRRCSKVFAPFARIVDGSDPTPPSGCSRCRRSPDLIRQAARPVARLDRLSLNDEGRVHIRSKRPWMNRTTGVPLEPAVFPLRLAAAAGWGEPGAHPRVVRAGGSGARAHRPGSRSTWTHTTPWLQRCRSRITQGPSRICSPRRSIHPRTSIAQPSP